VASRTLHLKEIRSDQPTVSSFVVKRFPHKIRIVGVQPKIGKRIETRHHTIPKVAVHQIVNILACGGSCCGVDGDTDDNSAEDLETFTI